MKYSVLMNIQIIAFCLCLSNCYFFIAVIFATIIYDIPGHKSFVHTIRTFSLRWTSKYRRDVCPPSTSKCRERTVVLSDKIRYPSAVFVAFVVFSWKSTGEVAGWRAKCKRIARTAPDINAQSSLWVLPRYFRCAATCETVIYSERSVPGMLRNMLFAWI